MDANKILIYAVVILAGISVGFIGPETYQDFTENLDSGTEEIEGEIISQDPELASFRQHTNETRNAENYGDITRGNFEEKKGPWYAGSWKFAPADVLVGENRSDSLIINSGPGGSGNALQVMRIPENSDTYLYMEGKSASGMVPGDHCNEIQTFLGIYLWEGELPMQIPDSDNIVDSSVKNKTATFDRENSSMSIEIPERFEGEPVIFFGGVTDKSLCGSGDPVNYLKMDRLLVAER